MLDPALHAALVTESLAVVLDPVAKLGATDVGHLGHCL
jgi:hypothetical protein